MKYRSYLKLVTLLDIDQMASWADVTWYVAPFLGCIIIIIIIIIIVIIIIIIMLHSFYVQRQRAMWFGAL